MCALEPPKKPHPQPRFVDEFPPRVKKRWLAMVLLQLSIFMSMIMAGMLWASSDWAKHNKTLDAIHPYAFIVSGVLTVVIYIIMCLASFVASWWPVNMVLLLLFTLSLTYLMSAVASEYNTLVVVHVLVLVVLVLWTLVLYTWFPYGGFSHLAAGVYCILVIAVFGFFVMLPQPGRFMPSSDWDWEWTISAGKTEREQATDAVGVWLALLVAIGMLLYVDYELYSLAQREAPHMVTRAVFILVVDLAFIMFAYLKAVGTLATKVTSCSMVPARSRTS